MKSKQFRVLLLIACCVFGTVGCGKNDDFPIEVPSSETSMAPVEESTVPEEDAEQVPEADITQEPEEDASQKMIVYYGDTNAEFIISKEVMVSAVTDQEILHQLVEVGILEDGIELNDMKVEANCLYLDFNTAFGQSVQSMGTSGERILIGSVVNTFLGAYPECDKVLITVEGETLESGHEIYEEPMTFYQAGVETYLTVNVSIEGESQEVEMTRVYDPMGFSMNYNMDLLNYTQEEEISSLNANVEGITAILVFQKSDYGMEDTIEGLQREFTENPTVEEIELGTENITATQISGPTDSPELTTVYYVLQNEDETWIIELYYSPEAEEGLLPMLEATLDSFVIVR